jgi:hypothetical protein
MFVTPLLALFPKRSNNIPQRTQALIDALRLPDPLLLRAVRKAHIQPLAPRQIHEIQAALAPLPGARAPVHADVHAADAQREHRVRARRALVHQRRRNAAPRLRDREQRPHLRRRRQRHDLHVGHARAARLRVVFDLVFLLVEFTLAQEVVDRFVVLCSNVRIGKRGIVKAYNLQELAL